MTIESIRDHSNGQSVEYKKKGHTKNDEDVAVNPIIYLSELCMGVTAHTYSYELV